MYAIAMAILILLQDTFRLPALLLLIPCAIVPTTVEYLSGVLTRHVFNKDYWDYHALKFNFRDSFVFNFQSTGRSSRISVLNMFTRSFVAFMK